MKDFRALGESTSTRERTPSFLKYNFSVTFFLHVDWVLDPQPTDLKTCLSSVLSIFAVPARKYLIDK